VENHVEYNQYIGRPGAVIPELNVTKTNDDYRYQGYMNLKHCKAIIDIHNQDGRRLINNWIARAREVTQELKSVPYGIESKQVKIPKLPGLPPSVSVPHKVTRIGAIFRMHDTHLELMPFTDISKLEETQ
jgi:hypothetical protein